MNNDTGSDDGFLQMLYSLLSKHKDPRIEIWNLLRRGKITSISREGDETLSLSVSLVGWITTYFTTFYRENGAYNSKRERGFLPFHSPIVQNF